MASLRPGYARPARHHGIGKACVSTGRESTYRNRNAVARNRATSLLYDSLDLGGGRMQRSFAEVDGFRKQRKVTRREVFLAEMARVVPWRRLEALIEPHYPKAGNGRKPYPLGVMLRVHFLQHWYGYSDPAMEDALHDMPALRRFAGLDAGESRMPDETTILNFRHLLEAHQLAESLF